MAILFIKDWANCPGAILHTKTKNRSFVRLAGLLKRMGIKNHAFLLALHNPLLEDLDPHDDNLTNEQKIMIAKECKENPWYILREVVRVPPPAGNDPIMFKANRANISTIWLLLNHITAFLEQPRQTGKSLTGDALDAIILNFIALNANISILTKDDKLRTKTALQIKDLIERFPKYLQLMNKKDIKNSERITVKDLGNSLNIYVGQKDKKAADNLGRGMTTPIVRIDEFAYIYNIEITLPVLLSAASAAREVARDANAPYYTLFTTTPGKLNSKEGKFAYKVYNDAVRWNERFYDSRDENELNNIVEKNTKQFKVVLLEFNHRQLGFTDQWLKDRIKDALSSGEAAESDYLMKWTAGNLKSPITRSLMEVITKSKKNDFYADISKYGYVIKWYVSTRDIEIIRQKKFLIIGLDTSDALGGKNDDIGLVIRDSRTGAVLGVGKYNETNLATFADFLVDLLVRFPNSLLIPERRSSATAIMDSMFRIMLLKNMNPFKRIFNWIVNKMDEQSQDIINETLKVNVPRMNVINKYKRAFGFATGGSGETSRGLLYGNVFRSSVNYTADKVYDSELILQLGTLKIANNRIDHDEDGHDDLVISWLLGFWILLYAKNTKFYGLDKRYILNNVMDNELLAETSTIDKNILKEQQKIRATIELFIDKLKDTKNINIAEKIVNRIRTLESKLNPNIIKSFNIEEILNNIKLYKKLKRNK